MPLDRLPPGLALPLLIDEREDPVGHPMRLREGVNERRQRRPVLDVDQDLTNTERDVGLTGASRGRGLAYDLALLCADADRLRDHPAGRPLLTSRRWHAAPPRGAEAPACPGPQRAGRGMAQSVRSGADSCDSAAARHLWVLVPTQR